MKQNRRTLHKDLAILGAWIAILWFVLLSFNPVGSPVILALLPIGIGWAVVYMCTKIIAQYMITARHSSVWSAALATIAVLFAMLSGLRQLESVDAILIGLLVGVVIFYYRRTRD